MPTIESVIAAQRQRIAAREEPVYRALRRAYSQAIDRLAADLDAVTARIDAALAAGEPVGPSWLAREARYQRLLSQADIEFQRFGGEGARIIQAGTRLAATAGASDALTLLDAGGLRIGTANLPTVATERLVASFAPESPLTKVFRRYSLEAVDVIQQRLVEAVTGGLGPRAVAGQIARDLGSPGQRARLLSLVRNEMMRSYRGGTAATYQQVSHLLDGVVWIAALSPRTCKGCLGMHLSEHPVGYVMATHSQCRCTVVAKVTGSRVPLPPSGGQWLADQPVSVQRDVLGAAYDGFKRGKINLSDFIQVRHSDDWGDSVTERSVRDVLGRVTG